MDQQVYLPWIYICSKKFKKKWQRMLPNWVQDPKQYVWNQIGGRKELADRKYCQFFCDFIAHFGTQTELSF